MRLDPNRHGSGLGLWLLIMLLCTNGFGAHADEAVGDADLAAFDGLWERIDDPRDEARRIASIGDAVDGMSWLMRGMARGVLSRSTRPPSEIQFLWDGSELNELVGSPEEKQSWPIRLDGSPRFKDDDNGEVALSWHPAPNGMKVRWEQHQAHGTNVYRVAQDGDLLVVEHTIQITALSNIEPIVYRSHFARRGALPSVAADLSASDSTTTSTSNSTRVSGPIPTDGSGDLSAARASLRVPSRSEP